MQFPAFCLRRMEQVSDAACRDCFTNHLQLQQAHRLRTRCVEQNLVNIEPAPVVEEVDHAS